jgi:hypothetical protein
MVSHSCTWSSRGICHSRECRNILNQIGGACIDKNIAGKQPLQSVHSLDFLIYMLYQNILNYQKYIYL